MTCKIVQDYVITPYKLGEGSFGIVYRGYVKDKKTELLAVKAIPLKSIKNEEVVKREIEILMKLSSPNIVKFYRPSKTANHLYFFLQYCEQDLKTYVRSKGGKLSETEVQNILTQICKGFEVVHSNNVIHRDIKPANFLIHQGVIKISDFGFARVVDDLSEAQIRTFLGSPLYMAPQILAKEKFNSKCDIWSLGITIFEFLYGYTPFTAKNPKELLDNIKSKALVFPEIPQRSEEIKSLLRRMLTVNEEERISWVELFKDGYIRPKKEEVPENEDSLVQSFAQNNIHLSKHKVITRTTSDDILIEQECQAKESEAPKQPVENDFNQELKEQTEQIEQYLKIEEIDQIMRYKRNVSVFLNVQCSQFFTLASHNFDQVLFHLGLYALLTRQIQIHREVTLELRQPTFKNVSTELWIKYKQSSAYTRIMKLLTSDLKHLENYLAQVSKRVNKSGELFKIYSENEKEGYKDIMLRVVGEVKFDKFFAAKLLITIQPFKYLPAKLDFGLFYENEAEEMEKLMKKFPELISK